MLLLFQHIRNCLFRAAKNNPQYGYGNRNEGMGPSAMGPTANNWGGGYGEMNTNMNNMMNTMNNMVRDNGVRFCVFVFVFVICVFLYLVEEPSGRRDAARCR